ncbi:hypothetical protein HK099_006794 [Clydaea vesicula]|uniref:Uncharacterized protein n=1 Tax=Clydaea vesicula TaxID=447962 RepID=A0AAD5TZU9_9FUNG|nr:hypothetical protein HK099_006794 [Clydaea vesicula]
MEGQKTMHNNFQLTVKVQHLQQEIQALNSHQRENNKNFKSLCDSLNNVINEHNNLSIFYNSNQNEFNTNIRRELIVVTDFIEKFEANQKKLEITAERLEIRVKSIETKLDAEIANSITGRLNAIENRVIHALERKWEEIKNTAHN